MVNILEQFLNKQFLNLFKTYNTKDIIQLQLKTARCKKEKVHSFVTENIYSTKEAFIQVLTRHVKDAFFFYQRCKDGSTTIESD